MPRSILNSRPELLTECKTFSEQLTAWLEIAGRVLSASTIREYRQMVPDFFNVVDKKTVIDIVKSDALTYIDYCKEKGLKTYTIKNRLIVVQGFCRFYGINPQFDMPIVRKRREETIRRQLISPDDLDKFLRNCPTPRDRLIAALLWETGIRASELLGIKWKHIDFEKMTVYIEKRKGGNVQTLPFGDMTLSTLTEWKNSTPSNTDNDHVFINLKKGGHGQSLHYNGLVWVIKSVGEKAGWKPEQIHPHAFRHSFATYSQTGEHRLTPFQVQCALGHSGIQTTAIYTRILESDLTDAYARRYRQSSRVGIEEPTVNDVERCPSCGGIRLAWHQVCPCGHDYSDTKYERLKTEIKDLSKIVQTLTEQIREYSKKRKR